MMNDYIRKSDVIDLMRNNMRCFMAHITAQDVESPMTKAFIRGVVSHNKDLIRAVSNMPVVSDEQ